MRASELRPGQFFLSTYGSTGTTRYMCIGHTDTHALYVYPPFSEIFYYHHNNPVQQLNVHGWDDEPQSEPIPMKPTPAMQRISEVMGEHQSPQDSPVKPAPLQLREGAWYRRRDGEVVGPMQKLNGNLVFQFWLETSTHTWSASGKIWSEDCKSDYDLIAEVPPPDIQAEVATSVLNKLFGPEVPPPVDQQKLDALLNGKPWPPVEPEQFKAGDWVVCVDGNCDVVTGSVYQVASIDSDDLIYVGVKRDGYFRRRFRQATPAEIEQHRKQGSCQGHATGEIKIPHHLKMLGNENPTATVVNLETGERKTVPFAEAFPEPQTDADGWIEWTGGECPVPEGVPIDVRFRDGYERLNSTSYNTCKTFWLDENNPADIVAYRLVQPAPITHWVEEVK